MVATATGISSDQGHTVSPPRTKRRLSQVLFGFLQTATVDPEHRSRSIEIAGDQLGRQLADALSLRQAYYLIPAELTLVPDRVTSTPAIRAAGFSDSRSESVGVDVASWEQPCCETLDDIAWRRVFTWILGTDPRLTNVSILAPPARLQNRLVGTYGYEADGIPGYGVLQVASTGDGCWQICDCWGDATEADRVDALANAVAPA